MFDLFLALPTWLQLPAAILAGAYLVLSAGMAIYRRHLTDKLVQQQRYDLVRARLVRRFGPPASSPAGVKTALNRPKSAA